MSRTAAVTADPDYLVAGVDTHADTHTLALVTAQGGVVETATFAADADGYTALAAMLEAAEATIEKVGVEGTNSYGAGLTRALTAAGYTVYEVLRPARRVRRRHGKSDPIDAVAAARTVLSGDGAGEAKDTTGPVEAVRLLLTARTQLVTTMTAISNTINSLLVTADESVRDAYRRRDTPTAIKHLAACRPGNGDSPAAACLYALRSLARTHREASAHADELEKRMHRILAEHYPRLLAIYGAGTIVAAQLAVTAGGNPERIRNEAAFAALCGAAPIPASSGKTTRHRLNRGGDRRGNAALHRIALVRMRFDPATRAYTERRTGEGKTKKEILRCLKRAIAREVYTALQHTAAPAPTTCDELAALRAGKNLTLTDVAAALDTYPARISDIEKHRRPLPELTDRYRQWLHTA